MPDSKQYALAGQDLAGRAGVGKNSPAYKRAMRGLKSRYEQAAKATGVGDAALNAAKATPIALAAVEVTAGTIALAGAGTGGSGFATAAMVSSAAAGPVGVIVAAAIIGSVVGIAAIAAAARKGKANALAASDLHGVKGREWGRAYLHFWNVEGRKDTNALFRVKDRLIGRIDKLKAKKSTKKRRRKLKRLKLRASALSTVFLEVALDAPTPARTVTESRFSPAQAQEDAIVDDGEDGDDASPSSSFLPKAMIGLSLLRWLL